MTIKLSIRVCVTRRGSVGELFSDPRWRYNAIIGMLLAFAGVVGLWGIGFFSFDLFRAVLDKTNLSAGDKTFWIGMVSLLQNLGAFFGIYAFTHLTQRIGRKPELHENERALLKFIRQVSPSIQPDLLPLMVRVA